MDDLGSPTTPAGPTTKAQPLISRKMATRGALALAIAAILLAGMYFIGRLQDPDFGTANTAGWLAAVQRKTDGGSQVVLIRPDGTLVPSPDYTPGARDRDPVWRPDGNRLFFASDRGRLGTQIYRWNPASNKVERRTQEKGTYTSLSFPEGNGQSALVERGGRLFEFEPATGVTRPVLPPATERVETAGADSEGGLTSAFEALYGTLGTSFKSGRWLKGKRWIAAVLRREHGEILVLQNMQAGAGALQRPTVVAAGDRIEYDVNPRTGEVAYVSIGFQFPGEVPPEFVKNGKVVPPARHFLGLVDPDNPPARPVMLTRNDRSALWSPTFSPDGSMILLVTGHYHGESGFTPRGLITIPAREGAAQAASRIRLGNVREPNWSADGKLIAYLFAEGSSRSLRIIESTGSNERTLAEGDYATPRFSPQTAGS